MDEDKREHEQLSRRVLEREREDAKLAGTHGVRLSCSGKENAKMLTLLDVKGGCGAIHVLRHSTMCKLFFQSFAKFFHVLDIIACCLDT